jgi:hypothetical protein
LVFRFLMSSALVRANGVSGLVVGLSLTTVKVVGNVRSLPFPMFVMNLSGPSPLGSC